jgi:predicted acylesterase/phospholipase RssA/CRP-like cAMP-binding protein
MAAAPRREELLALPLFAGVTPRELRALDGHCTVLELRHGDVVFHRGDDGDALYVVLGGQVAMELEGTLLALCGPGDWFGEMALLGGGTRSADARVRVDATLLRIDRDGWTALGARTPHVFARLSERLSRQLRRRNDAVPVRRGRVVACADAVTWLRPLVASIRRQFPGRAVHVLRADGADVTEQPERPLRSPSDPAALAHALAPLVAPDVTILVLTDALPDLADLTVRRTAHTEWAITGRGDEVVRGRAEDDTIDRLARRLMGGMVGVALGAGGAYGLAHLGLLAVLERERIPVDVVAGSSIGAIVGAAVAAGVTAERAADYAVALASRFRTILIADLDLRGRTLLTGASVQRILGELAELRDATFASLTLPFEAVAMDVGSGAEVVLREGPVLEGIQPSFAMPGIFPPCMREGRRLVDGAMVNPVPVDRVRGLGADVVIASQPIAPLQDGPANPLDQIVERGQRLLDWLPLGPLRGGIDTLGVSLRSFQSLWYHLSNVSARTADVVFAPELRRFWFLQFGASDAIIAAGRHHAEELLPELRATLRARAGLAV